MTDRKKYPELIVRFNSGEMSPEEREQFLQMMEKDKRLRDEVLLDQELDKILGQDDLLDLRSKLIMAAKRSSARNRTTFLLMAASILILLALGVCFYLQRTKIDPLPSHTKKELLTKNVPPVDSPGKNQKNKTDAEFISYPPYESLTGGVLRASGFEMIKPEEGEKFSHKSTIILEFRTAGDKITIISISDNKGNDVLKLAPSAETAEIPPGKLNPGVYYYKIISGEETVFVGKFFIRKDSIR